VSRTYSLAEQTDGINLMRSKGGASDKALFDLVNGYISAKGTISARPGAPKYDAVPNSVGFPTKGLVGSVGSMGGVYATFVHAPFSYSDAKAAIKTLRHPTSTTAVLVAIHAAFPFLTRLYVVAEFDDGLIQHYWLDEPDLWTANTVLGYGYRVRANAVGFGPKNGFYYRATNVDTTIAWTASTTKVVGNFVQPTIANGFKYEATAVTGAAPVQTGSTEPTWPTTDGATIVERRYASAIPATPGSSTPPIPTGPGSKPGEYSPYPNANDGNVN
jgi:hypothetical protein